MTSINNLSNTEQQENNSYLPIISIVFYMILLASSVAGQKMIFVNEGVSARQGQTSVGQHEFLHGLIAETIKDDPEAQQLLGKTLADELLKMQKVIDTKGE